jgi:hypothetical protein
MSFISFPCPRVSFVIVHIEKSRKTERWPSLRKGISLIASLSLMFPTFWRSSFISSLSRPPKNTSSNSGPSSRVNLSMSGFVVGGATLIRRLRQIVSITKLPDNVNNSRSTHSDVS